MLRIAKSELMPISGVERDFDEWTAAPFAEKLGAIARRHDNPKSNAFHPDAFWESVRLFAAEGLTTLGIPEEYGGMGGTSRLYALATRRFCAADAGIGLSVGATKSLFIDPILIFGTEEQKQRWVVPFVNGELIGCYCQTEPGAGSDVAAKTVKAVQQPDGSFRITGEFTFITNGSEANAGLAMAVTNSASSGPGGKFTMFILDFDRAKADGTLTVESNFTKIGLHHSPTTVLRFDDCYAAAEDILGKLHGGWKVAMQLLTDSRATVIAMQGLGVMEAVRRVLDEYTKNRKLFGTPTNPGKTLAQFRRTRAQRLTLAARCEGLFWLTMLSATAKDKAKASGDVDSQQYSLEASCSKLLAGEWAMWSAIDGFELHGGIAYMLETLMALLLCDSFIVRTYEGAKAVQCSVIVKELLMRLIMAVPETAQKVFAGQNPFDNSEPLRGAVARVWPLSVLEMESEDTELRERFLFLFGEAAVDADFGVEALQQEGRDQAMVWALLAEAYATLMTCELVEMAEASASHRAMPHQDARDALDKVASELKAMQDPAYRAVLKGEDTDCF